MARQTKDCLQPRVTKEGLLRSQAVKSLDPSDRCHRNQGREAFGTVAAWPLNRNRGVRGSGAGVEVQRMERSEYDQVFPVVAPSDRGMGAAGKCGVHD